MLKLCFKSEVFFMKDFVKQLNNYRLTTAKILYHMPDHPALLQTYIWQDLDISPNFPTLMKFLDYWEHHLDGKLHSVAVTHTGLIQPAELQYYSNGFRLH